MLIQAKTLHATLLELPFAIPVPLPTRNVPVAGIAPLLPMRKGARS